MSIALLLLSTVIKTLVKWKDLSRVCAYYVLFSHFIGIGEKQCLYGIFIFKCKVIFVMLSMEVVMMYFKCKHVE